MPQATDVNKYMDASNYNSILCRLKIVTKSSSHSQEQAAYDLICDLETMLGEGLLTHEEFTFIIGKATDVLMYFRYDMDGLSHEDSWYRASVIHQMGCGMLEALRIIRPGLTQYQAIGDIAHQLYFAEPLHENSRSTPGPIGCKRW